MAFDPEEFRADLQKRINSAETLAERYALACIDDLGHSVRLSNKVYGMRIALDLFNAQWAAQEERPKRPKIRVRIRDGSLLR